MPITLYHYWRSSASWRVRWGLEIKGVSHKKAHVNLLAGEEKDSAYLARNPSGYLPCLINEGKPPLAESMAILEWLEETYPEPSLFVGDSYRRALVRQLAETINSGTQPLQNLDVLKKISDDKDRQAEWAQHWMLRGLGVYEAILSRSGRAGKKFSLSDSPTIADICLIPQCYTALRFHIDLEQFPQCKAIYEYALSTKECAASLPELFQPK